MKPIYLIIDCATQSLEFTEATVNGPFSTLADAQKYIKQNAKQTCIDGNEIDIDPTNWGCCTVIAEIKQIVIPVPIVSVSVKLKELKCG